MVEQLNAVARVWWDWSAAMFWQAGLLILLIGCIDLIIRKWAWPQLRYALWSLILVKLILPPTLSLPSGIVPELRPVVGQVLRWLNSSEPAADQKPTVISDCGLSIADSIFSRGPQFGMVETASGAFQPPLADEGATMADSALAANPQSAIPNPQLEWQFYAMTIWLAGTLILGIWLLLRLHSLAGRPAHQAAAASLPQSFYSQLAGGAKRLGLRRIPGVVVTKRLTSPAVFGVFRPVLLMPQGYLSQLSRRDTEHMLLHELAHVKRGDLLVHGLYLVLQIGYWYNPLLWLVRRQMHHLRELSCDATVAALLRERTAAYRQTLLETARRLLATSVEPGLGLLGLFEDSNRLLVRLHWLTKPTWRYRTMKRLTVATSAALMLACVLPMAQAQPEATAEDIQTPETLPIPEHVAHLQQQMRQVQQQRQQLQQQLQLMMDQLEQRRVQFVEDPSSRELLQIYTVRPGDTLAGLGDRFTDSPDGTTEEETIAQIIKANRLTNTTGLQVGQTLLIPRSAEVTEKIVSELAASEQRARDVSQLLVKARSELDDSGILAVEMARSAQAALELERAKDAATKAQAQAKEAQAREAASNKATPVSNVEAMPVSTEGDNVQTNAQTEDELSRTIAALQGQLERLMARQQDSQNLLRALDQKRQQMGQGDVEDRREAPLGRARGYYEVYTVKEGDTLASIAREFYGQENLSESIARIVKQNHLEDSDRLRVGQELWIPAAPEPQAREGGKWVFQDGRWRWAPVPPASAEERSRRAEEEALRAAAEAEKAQARITREEARVQREQARQWEQSEPMRQWRSDMEEWKRQVQQWAEQLGHQLARPEDSAGGVPEPGPMPAMPPLPTLPLLGDVPGSGPAHPETLLHGDGVPHVGAPPAPVAPMPHVRVAPTPHVSVTPRPEPPVKATVPHVPAMPPGQVEPVPHVSVPRTRPAAPVPPATPVPSAIPSPARDDRGQVVSCGEYVVESFPAGTRLEVQNEVGSVTVEGTADGKCTVKATARIKGVDEDQARQLAQGIKVHLTPTDGRLRVHAEMPEGLTEEQRNRIEMDFHIIVPQEAEARIAQKVGQVRLSSLLGKVQAAVNVGSIQASDLQGDILLRTEVGNIDFVASRDLSAKVQAQANVGSITSNLPLRITSAAAVQGGGMQSALGSNATGVLGDGQNKIDLSANVGSIAIRSQPAAPHPVL